MSTNMAAKVSDKNKVTSFPNNENWMSQLSETSQNIPLNQLAIPGTHDSASFEFDKNGGVGPDADQIVKDLEKLFGPFIKDILYRWAKTQNMNFTQQLQAGIRYLDLRVSTRPDHTDLYFVHSLYADKVETCLHDVDIFLDAHPKEIVILDFNHFYAMNTFLHKQLISMIIEIFGPKVCPLVDMNSLTLEMMWENKLQVIIMYHDVIATENHMLWPGSCIRAPWANTVNVKSLIEYLDNVYNMGHSNEIFLSYQGILTANTKYVIEHVMSSLEKSVSEKATPAIVKWLADKEAGANKLNICIVDIAEQFDFISTVISKNK